MGFLIAMLRCTFSISTVASFDQDPTARDSPPRVMRLRLFADAGQHDDRNENREGNGDDDDDGAPPAPQEEQDHQRGQPCGDARFLDDSLDGRPNVERLVEQEIHLVLGRKGRHDTRQDASNALHDVERRSARALEEAS